MVSKCWKSGKKLAHNDFVNKSYIHVPEMLKNYCDLSFYPIFNILVPDSFKKQKVFQKNVLKNLRGIKWSKNERKI